MFSAGISALTDRVDSSFFTAYLLPAFVAVLGAVAIATHVVGAATVASGAADLSSVGQSLAALALLLAIVMVAFLLRALTRAILAVFAGDLLPAAVAGFLRHGQPRTAKHAANPVPADPDAPAPTELGNELQAAAAYPWRVYAMDGVFWWPRLKPLLPSEFTEQLAAAQAPMMGLLNLSLVFVTLGCGVVIVVGVLDRQVGTALAWLIGGLVLARLCYAAAVRQAGEVGSLIRVAFDLYRHAILEQLDVAAPDDLTQEQALWQQLTQPRLDAATAAGLAAKRAAWQEWTEGRPSATAPVAAPHDAAPKRHKRANGDDQ
jgi:hypothetical protein